MCTAGERCWFYSNTEKVNRSGLITFADTFCVNTVMFMHVLQLYTGFATVNELGHMLIGNLVSVCST